MRNITLIILTFILFACGQNKSNDKTSEIVTIDRPENQLEKYILKPASTDSMCLKDIAKAKNDIANGKLIFTAPMGFGTHHLRQEEELRKLCKTYDLLFDYEMFGCIVYEGQTAGCYGAYMTKTIEDKYGKGFKEILLAKADSMLLAKSDTIAYYLCDKRPQIPGQTDHDRLFPNINEKIKKQLKPDNEGRFPFMDIGFYIDKEGFASGYFINSFHDADNKSNQKFKKVLFELGIEELKKIKVWETGEIGGQKVNTENNVRVYY